MAIPRIIHQYWTGDWIPEHLMAYSRAWRRMNPGWAHYLWHDSSLKAGQGGLINDRLWRDARKIARPGREHQLRADIVRYELLHSFGGVWIDMDFEPLKPLDSWFGELDPERPFAVWEVQDKWAANGMMGGPADHWFWKLLIRRLPQSAMERGDQAPTRISGPQFMTEIHREQGEPLQILGPERFYPYLWSDLNRNNDRCRPPWPPECVAVHHWNNRRNQLKVKMR